MKASLHRPWFDHADDVQPAFHGASGAWVTVRGALTPTNGLIGGVLVLGWLALVGWTGVGPAGWQARSCAGLALRPASCETVRPGKDGTRIVPHADAARGAP